MGGMGTVPSSVTGPLSPHPSHPSTAVPRDLVDSSKKLPLSSGDSDLSVSVGPGRPCLADFQPLRVPLFVPGCLCLLGVLGLGL